MIWFKIQNLQQTNILKYDKYKTIILVCNYTKDMFNSSSITMKILNKNIWAKKKICWLLLQWINGNVLCIGGVTVIHANLQRYALPFEVCFVIGAARRYGVSIHIQMFRLCSIWEWVKMYLGQTQFVIIVLISRK